MMTISNEQIEEMMTKYQCYVAKIINRKYSHADYETRKELRQAGMIGLWKGIKAYYRRDPKRFDEKEFVDTICAYMRYEMADLFHERHIIRISGKHWRNYVKVKKILDAHPEAPEGEIIRLASAAGLRYEWYVKTSKTMNCVSLDAGGAMKGNADKYDNIQYYDYEAKKQLERSYIRYIISSAFAGVKFERDRQLLSMWLFSVYSGAELGQNELGKKYGLSSGMVGVIINRFIHICQFVRGCEYEFIYKTAGLLCFPEVAEKRKTYKGQKIPGVKWIPRNRKWRVEITTDKDGSVFIGYYDTYEEAVKARRNAEVRYRGKSNILVGF